MIRWWAPNKFSEANHLMILSAELLQLSLPAVPMTLAFLVQGVKLGRRALHRVSAQNSYQAWVIGEGVSACSAKPTMALLSGQVHPDVQTAISNTFQHSVLNSLRYPRESQERDDDKVECHKLFLFDS